MLTDTLESLIHGDNSVVEKYKKAKWKWDAILQGFDWDAPDAVQKMKDIVYQQQTSFEHLIGDRWLGHELMVVVGIGQFYDPIEGFGDNLKKAKLIQNAILISYCSLEVKHYAKEIENIYDLVDVNNNPAYFF